MLREETKEFVNGHLSQCAVCRAELDALRADVTPQAVSAQPLRELKAALRRKKLTAVLLAVTLALTLATAGVRVPHRTAVFAVRRDRVGDHALSPRARGDGSAVGWAYRSQRHGEHLRHPACAGVRRKGHEYAGPEQRQEPSTSSPHGARRSTRGAAHSQTVGTANTHSARSHTARGGRTAGALAEDGVRTHALHARRRELRGSLLFSEQRAGRCAALRQRRTAVSFRCRGWRWVLRFAIVCTPYYAWYCIFRLPQEKIGKALGYLALIPACYLAGHLLVKGFTTTSYQMQRDFSLIILAAALIYAAVMLAINLWRQKREKV